MAGASDGVGVEFLLQQAELRVAFVLLSLPKALAMSRQFVVCVAETEPQLLRAARVTPFWQALSPQSVGVWHQRPQWLQMTLSKSLAGPEKNLTFQ